MRAATMDRYSMRLGCRSLLKTEGGSVHWHWRLRPSMQPRTSGSSTCSCMIDIGGAIAPEQLARDMN